MYVRFLCNWPPYKDGQCLEIPDRIGADFVARCMAQVVTAADVREYLQTMAAVDRAIEKRMETPSRREVLSFKHHEMPARAGRRVVSEDDYAREIGQDQPGYWQAAMANRQAQRQAQPSRRHHS